MSRLIPILSALACCALFAACSKKEEAASSVPPGDEPATLATEETPLVQFKLPGAAGETAPSPGAAGVVPTARANPPAGSTNAEGMQSAEMIVFFPPFYPITARMEGIEGRVDLGLAIDAKGEVTKVEVLAATAPQFRDHAVAAAKDWKFIPARLDGNPVAVNVTFPVPFISEFGSGEFSMNSPLARLTYIDGMYYSTGPDGRLTPANVEVSPLIRVTPAFRRAETETKQLRTVLNFTVSEEGQVLDATIVEKSDSDFDKAALTAIKYWQFVPQIRNGTARRSSVKLPIVYGAEEVAR